MLFKYLQSLTHSLVIFLNVRFQLFGGPRIVETAFKKTIVDEGILKHFENLLIVDKEPHWKFRQRQQVLYPATFITEFSYGRVWGNQGAVITQDNIFFGPVSREYEAGGRNHSIFKQRHIVKSKPLEGRIAIIAASGGEVYYHWMMDIMPRINLLKRSQLFSSIDKFIINYKHLPFQRELLAIVGVPEEKIIPSTDHWNFHVEAQTLVVPSLVSPNDCPSAEACFFIRNLFAAQRSSRKPFRNIYIQRTKGRTIVNEQELLTVLDKEGFEIFNPELMTVAEQAYLFSEAKYVIAPHGAGLTNLVFCEPGTIVIDLFSPEWVNPCYWILSGHLGLKYSYLIGEGKRPPEGVDRMNKAAHITLNLVKLAELMRVVEL